MLSHPLFGSESGRKPVQPVTLWLVAPCRDAKRTVLGSIAPARTPFWGGLGVHFGSGRLLLGTIVVANTCMAMSSKDASELHTQSS